jgi:subtilisin family serine protease
MERIGADQAKAAGLTGEGVKVAVVDTGVDSNHPDLRGKVVAAKDFTGLGSPIDEDGHGTFVASEIAGTGAASDGVFAGVAPGAQIVNARVLDADGSGSNSEILAGIEWAAKEGAQVINLSLGDPGMYGDGTSYFDQFVNQIAKDYGCLIVVAAGNDGRPQTVSTPAVADEVLSVGATSQDGNRAWFSSAGPRRGDGAVNPQIVAPGAGGEAPGGAKDADGDDDGDVGQAGRVELAGMTGAQAGSNGYVSDQMGTSMAAPLVAGAAALMIESDPSWNRQALRAKLVASAAPAPDGASVFEQGAGLLNIPKALSQTLTTSPTELNLGMAPFPATGTVTQTLTYVNAGAASQDLTLEAGLTFADYQGPVVNSTDPPGPAKSAGGKQADDADSGAASLRPDHIALSAPSLTVPAGGQASVDVTIDVEAFAAGYAGGYITATDTAGGPVLRTPVGLAKEPEKHRLTITATDHDGKPIENSDLSHSLSMFDLNRGWFMPLKPTQGEVALDLPAGDYALLAYSAKSNSTGGVDELAAAVPVLGLAADRAVNVGGTSAKRVTAPVDRPVTGIVSAQVTVAIGDPDEDGTQFSTGFASAASPFVANSIYVASAPEGDGVAVTYAASASLSQPLTEGALDSCGTRPVALEDASDRPPAGQKAFALVVAGQEIPAGGSADQALLVELTDPDPSEQTIVAVAQALAEVRAAGYGAVVIGSNRPTVALAVARLAAHLAAGEDGIGDFRVLVSDKTGVGQLASAAEKGESLHTLGRGTPEYVYQLAENFGSDAEALTLAGDDQSTAELTVRHPAMGSGGQLEDYFWGDWAVTTAPVVAQPGSSYVARVAAGKPWYIGSTLMDSDSGESVNEFLSAELKYPAGHKAVAVIRAQVHGAGFDPLGGITVSRDEDSMYGRVPLFVDGRGQAEVGRNPDAAPGYGAIDLKLTDVTSGDVLFESSADSEEERGWWVDGLDPAAHTYRLDEVTTSDSDVWSLSTKVSASWQWDSQAVSEASVAPLWQVWHELEGLDAGNAGAPDQPISLHVSQLPGSPTMPPAAVGLEASTDGGVTWKPVELGEAVADSASGWTYSGRIAAEPGAVVSLRSRAAAGTSSFDQTVIAAYPVTDSPRGFAPPESWSSCGGEQPAPTQTAPGPAPSDQPTGAVPPPGDASAAPGPGDASAAPGPRDASAAPGPRDSSAAPGARGGSLPLTGAAGIGLMVLLSLAMAALGTALLAKARRRARGAGAP